MCDLGWGRPLKTHYSPCFLCYFVLLFLFTPSLLPTPILHRRKILFQEMVVGEVLAHPTSQCLQSREIKEGHQLTLAVSTFDFHKS